VIWKLRRYCEDFQWLKNASEEHRDDRYNKYITMLQGELCRKNAHKFRLIKKGYLEKVLDTEKFPEQRAELVYKNFYYGSYRRKKISGQLIVTSANPSSFLHPELYPWIIDHVKLNRDVRNDLDELYEASHQNTGAEEM
jgi:hypothetical protein